ncbi:tripartite tricarboxylate transporter TctB family protein [Microvirga lotononidis]|uniref:Tripartite tricarboxylate transporter TctB family n=1 Tax=Microvirga lotononidis TaxID=864069 RepID=I4YWN4_9HYPH|nr:tripartite tricarboxylate transporter TctB family protein [Microvirga lotononidis]EIM28376.1 Tripartite tricarboxylate transporter TctB family [Microvirga lotononidis]WQO27539.1 tripartite tricarboxylate transporter TctB family protein [Microvirga lotononidis]
MSAHRLPATLFGTVVIVLGVAVVVASRQIKTGFTYDVVGPAMFSNLIGIGLVLSGAASVISARRASLDDLPDQPKLNLWPVALISAALLLEAALISRLGWIPVVATMFVAGTYAFGDRRILSNAVIGLVLATLILLVFTLGLGIDLPLGPLEPLFQHNQ